MEDISKFPTLEIKFKIKIQKGKLIFVHAPQSENSLKIGAHLKKFSQNWFELISRNSNIEAHLISDGLICGGQLSHLRRQVSCWSTEHSSPPHFPITSLSFSVCFLRNYGNYMAELSKQFLVFSLSPSVDISLPHHWYNLGARVWITCPLESEVWVGSKRLEHIILKKCLKRSF